MNPFNRNSWRTLLSGLLLSSMTTQAAITPADEQHSLIYNGDFATGTANWVTSNGWNSGNEMTISTADSAYCITITKKNATAAIYEFAVRQEGLTLQPGHTYTLKGKVWSKAPVLDIYVGIDMTASPYSFSKNFTVKTIVPPTANTIINNNLNFSYTHPASSAAQSGVHFGFQLGLLPLNAQVCFDDLEVNDPAYNKPAARVPHKVVVNQVGYLPNLDKSATYILPTAATNTNSARAWVLKKGGVQVASGQTIAGGAVDAASGLYVHRINFSSVTASGTDYVLDVTEGTQVLSSHKFSIGANLYANLKYDALSYFYHNRVGTPIEASIVGADFARAAAHVYDNKLSTADGLRANVDVSGGWYDAGDHGKYVVNAGISVWTLLNQFERARHLGANSSDFGLGSMKLPTSEKTNNLPDLLDEARWEIEWMLKMQVPTGFANAGMVHDKMHDDAWTDGAFNPVNATAAANPRHIKAVSTAATYNLAAVGAQCYRTFKAYDAVFAQKCLNAAVTAYNAAKANSFIAAPDSMNLGGGNYPDTDASDESYWAASELYLATIDPSETAYNHNIYATDMSAASNYHLQIPFNGQTSMSWQKTSALGVMSMATVGASVGADPTWISSARTAIKIQATTYATITQSSFGVPFNSSSAAAAYWGSNANVLNNIIVMGLARDFSCTGGTPDADLSNGIHNAMGYLLGRNPMDYSYVTGYGADPVSRPHHRFWSAINKVPAGVVVGGPNATKEDDEAKANLAGCISLRCYIDNAKAYSTNEVTINWNSPLAWASAYMDEMGSGRKPQSCGGINAQAGSINITSGNGGSLDLKALNTSQAGDSFTILNAPTKGSVTITNGVAVYTGGGTFTTSDSFTYTMTRAGVSSAPATITVTKAVVSTASCAYQKTLDTNVWNNTWQAQLAIQNTTSTAITGWSVDLEYAAGTSLGAWGSTGSWDAEVANLGGGKYRITGKPWNNSVSPGATLILGVHGTAGPQANGVNSTPAAVPLVSGTTCGSPEPKLVRFHSDLHNAIFYGTDGMIRLGATNIHFFNNTTTADESLIFKINNSVIYDFIHQQNCCRGSLYMEQMGVPVGPNTMTLSTGSSNPLETDTIDFLLTNARAECELSNVTQSGNNWTATIKVINAGYHPGSISTYYFEPALASDTVYKGRNWSASISWSEDYPGTGARTIARNVQNTDGKALVHESLSLDGNNENWYTYYFAAPDYVGEIAGRAPGATPASYSFNISGTGSFYLPSGKKPGVGCSFGELPSF